MAGLESLMVDRVKARMVEVPAAMRDALEDAAREMGVDESVHGSEEARHEGVTGTRVPV
jgi:hypothetical protein